MTKNIAVRSTRFRAFLFAGVGLALAAPVHAEVVTATMTGKIRASVCTVASPNITVPMGTHAVNDFDSAIGSVLPPVKFMLGLSCPNPQIQVLVTASAAGIVNASQGVFNVTGGATGVAIQLLNWQQVPLALGVQTDYGSTHQPDWDIPYFVRYYRTAATIGPGDANGEVTFTIEYR